jgi:hypothetical protein
MMKPTPSSMTNTELIREISVLKLKLDYVLYFVLNVGMCPRRQ